MNYFDGVKTIRAGLELEKNEYEENEADTRQLTNALVRRTREKQAKSIQKKFYYQTPRRGRSALKTNLKSQ